MAAFKIFFLVAVLVLFETSWCAPESPRAVHIVQPQPESSSGTRETSSNTEITDKSENKGQGSGTGTSQYASESNSTDSGDYKYNEAGVNGKQEAMKIYGELVRVDDKSKQEKGVAALNLYDNDSYRRENGTCCSDDKFSMDEKIEHRHINSTNKHCIKYYVKSEMSAESDNAYFRGGSKSQDTEYDAGRLMGGRVVNERQIYVNKLDGSYKSDGTTKSEGKSNDQYDNTYTGHNTRDETSHTYIKSKKD